MDYRIEMSVKPQWQDARGQGVVRRLAALPGLPPVRGIRTRSVYTVSANITPDEAEKVHIHNDIVNDDQWLVITVDGVDTCHQQNVA